jgi:hypothetical protein
VCTSTLLCLHEPTRPQLRLLGRCEDAQQCHWLGLASSQFCANLVESNNVSAGTDDDRLSHVCKPKRGPSTYPRCACLMTCASHLSLRDHINPYRGSYSFSVGVNSLCPETCSKRTCFCVTTLDATQRCLHFLKTAVVPCPTGVVRWYVMVSVAAAEAMTQVSLISAKSGEC